MLFSAPDRDTLRSHYDRLGAEQDREAWYEEPAYDDLIAGAAFADARVVVEIGCGTGRFATRLLSHHLAPDGRYVGCDLSVIMAHLARDAVKAWPGRAQVMVADAAASLPFASASADRVVAGFVLDLFTRVEADRVLSEARRVLRPGGLICAASLAPGSSAAQRLRAWGWRAVHAVAPLRVGGCRPVQLPDLLGTDWETNVYVRRNIKNCAIASIIAKAV